MKNQAAERYEIVEGGAAIKCLTCNLTSYHPEDVTQRYCGKCHVFHEDVTQVDPKERRQSLATKFFRTIYGGES